VKDEDIPKTSEVKNPQKVDDQPLTADGDVSARLGLQQATPQTQVLSRRTAELFSDCSSTDASSFSRRRSLHETTTRSILRR